MHSRVTVQRTILHDLGHDRRLRGRSSAVRWTSVALLGLGLTKMSLGGYSVDQLKQLSIDELMQVEVTSVSRSPTALAESPSALQVITSQEIRRSGASNLPEALRIADNLSVAKANAHDWGVAARGFNADFANKLLVMIDGRSVYTPLYSGVRWDVQDTLLEDVERIEVISGPGGSVWGANAVNGVINITTKNAAQTQGFYAEVGGGNQLHDFEGLRYGGQLASNVFFRIYGKHFERDSERLETSGADAMDDARLSQAGFRVDANATQAGDFTLQGDYYHGREGVVNAGIGHVAGGNLLSRWTKKLSAEAGLQLQVYYDRTYLEVPVPAGLIAPAGVLRDDLETYDVDFQHNFRAGERHSVVWGAGYRQIQDDAKNAPDLGFQPGQVRKDLFSAFAQDQVLVDTRTRLTFGAKVEHTEYTGFEVEPSVRLQRDLDGNTLVWGAISRAVRTPSRIDRDIRRPSTPPFLATGVETYRSESVVAYEVGLRNRLNSYLGGSLSVFYNDYEHVRSVHSTPATVFPLYFANDLEGESHGAELSFDADVRKGWRIHGGYRFLKSKLQVRPGGMDLNNALAETADPKNQINLGTSIDLPGNVEIDGLLRWVDELQVNNGGQPATVPSYFDLTLRLGVHLTDNVEFSINGANLLQDRHVEIGSPGLNRVEVQRSIFAKVALRY